MPRGVKEGSKRDRQYEHIKEGLRRTAACPGARPKSELPGR